MRLLQINIWQGRLLKNFVKLVKELNPDIITFQELCSSGDIESEFFNNLEVINEEFEYPYQVFSPTHSFPMMKYNINFGNAIFSKVPFVDTHTAFTNLEFKENFDFKLDDYNIRNFVHSVLEVNGKRLNVITHHGHHISGTKDGNDETKRQMQMIKDYIDSLEGGVILTGDFNLSPRSESLNVLNNKLTNLCIKHNIDNTRNEFASAAIQVCDYIFVNDEIKVEKFEVVDKVVSDHQALLLDFSI